MGDVRDARRDLDRAAAGARMFELVRELFPIARSITGNGVRETLRRIGDRIPLHVHEVPTGTQVLDWTVPREWNVADAHVTGPDGTRVVDFAASNLHLVHYSVPVRARMSLAELRPHLFSLPDRPSLVPYRTSYYAETWGFCLAHDDLERLPDGDYEVVIDSRLEDGALTYGELLLPGATTDEVLLTCHVDHPSLANDNLSGIAVVVALAEMLANLDLRHSYRFLLLPVTIGSITWLALNEERAERIRHGIVVSGVGDAAPLSFKRTRREDAAIDRIAGHVLRHTEPPGRLLDFHPYGYDERQFNSPGFDLPVGRLSRSVHGEYPEYHTSADDLSFISALQLADALDAVLGILEVVERDRTLVNLSPRGEPQLGRRGLYRTIGGSVDAKAAEMALLWVLNQCDGSRTLLDVAERSGMAFPLIDDAAVLLEDHGLLAPA